MVGLLLSGSAILIVYKFQNQTTYVDEHGVKQKFSHPFFAAAVTSLGQCMTLLLYWVKVFIEKRKKANERLQGSSSEAMHMMTPLNLSEIRTSEISHSQMGGGKEEVKKLNPLWLAVPSFFDIIETSFKNIPLMLIAASVTQMLRSSVVFFTAMLALIFLGKKLYRHHWTSLLCIITGIFLVGLSTIVAGKDNK